MSKKYSYHNQPNNIGCWRLGQACANAAAEERCGDYIDRGLMLLKQLQDMGFGVYKLPKEPTK